MYALVEKIPILKQGQLTRDAEYYHHKVLAAFPDYETAHISERIWSRDLQWYNPEVLDIKEVSKDIPIGTTLTLYGLWKAQVEINKGYGSAGTFRPYPKTTSLNGDTLKARFIKEGKNLLCEDYEIVPEKNIILVYHRVYQDETKDYSRSLVAKVDGYPSVKGIHRAKREVQYLIDEPEERENRITRGLIPVITPEGIVLSRTVRSEVPLMECSA
jgi:hypothetical protein